MLVAGNSDPDTRAVVDQIIAVSRILESLRGRSFGTFGFLREPPSSPAKGLFRAQSHAQPRLGGKKA